jgi:hypothetical protein
MNIPFTTEDFLRVIRSYNESVFPAQVIFNLLAILVIYLIFSKIKYKNKYISSALSFFFLWIGIIYQLMFFTEINKAAYLFGVLFIIQGILFFIYGVYLDKLEFSFKNNYLNYTGIFFILYAMLIYPLLGSVLGHSYPNSPTFGLPCPTVIFTFGVLLFIKNKISIFVLIIPVLWSLIGFNAAIYFTIYEDMGLLIAGIAGLGLLLFNNRRFKNVVNTSEVSWSEHEQH